MRGATECKGDGGGTQDRVAVCLNAHGVSAEGCFKVNPGGSIIRPASSDYQLIVEKQNDLAENAAKNGFVPALAHGKQWQAVTSGLCPNVSIAPWKANELSDFAKRVETPSTLWTDLYDEGMNFGSDESAKLIVRLANGNTIVLSHPEIKAYFQSLNKEAACIPAESVPLFLYIPSINKIKVLNRTSLEEVYQALNDNGCHCDIILLTCNGSTIESKRICYSDDKTEIKISKLIEDSQMNAQKEADATASIIKAAMRAELEGLGVSLYNVAAMNIFGATYHSAPKKNLECILDDGALKSQDHLATDCDTGGGMSVSQAVLPRGYADARDKRNGDNVYAFTEPFPGVIRRGREHIEFDARQILRENPDRVYFRFHDWREVLDGVFSHGGVCINSKFSRLYGTIEFNISHKNVSETILIETAVFSRFGLRGLSLYASLMPLYILSKLTNNKLKESIYAELGLMKRTCSRGSKDLNPAIHAGAKDDIMDLLEEDLKSETRSLDVFATVDEEGNRCSSAVNVAIAKLLGASKEDKQIHKAILERLLEHGEDDRFRECYTSFQKITRELFPKAELNFIGRMKFTPDCVQSITLDSDEINYHTWATNRRRIKIVKEFLKAARSGTIEIVAQSIIAGVDLSATSKQGVTALMSAVSNGHDTVVNMLLNAGADANSIDSYGRTVLMVAVSKNEVAIFNRLLAAKADVNATNQYGVTVLMFAVSNGNDKIVDLLLERKIGVDAIDNYGETALMLAVSNGHAEIVNTLLTAEASVNVINQDGNTALMLAISNGHAGIVNGLLTAGATVDVTSDLGCDALMEAGAKGHVDVIRELYNVGINVGVKNQRRKTALMHAVSNGHVDMVQFFLNIEVDLNSKDIFGDTALIYAVRNGSTEVIKMLLDAGANANAISTSDCPALIEVVWNRKDNIIDVIKAFLNDNVTVNINAVNLEGNTALMEAVLEGYTDVVEVLLQAGADVNSINNDNETALMQASARNDDAILRLLLKYGANIVTSKPMKAELNLMIAGIKSGTGKARRGNNAGGHGVHFFPAREGRLFIKRADKAKCSIM